ncbi:hypothetical protein [Haloferax sp. YSSS75]|uniref:hypothetical protein n=1 Tax=Haloferax sp. YSSS75 TaxID=3388564 RepID=UPI00398CBD51
MTRKSLKLSEDAFQRFQRFKHKNESWNGFVHRVCNLLESNPDQRASQPTMSSSVETPSRGENATIRFQCFETDSGDYSVQARVERSVGSSGVELDLLYVKSTGLKLGETEGRKMLEEYLAKKPEGEKSALVYLTSDYPTEEFEADVRLWFAEDTESDRLVVQRVEFSDVTRLDEDKK